MMIRRGLGLAINAHDLLPPGMRHSGDNARFGYGRIVFVFKNSADRNMFVAETFEQQTSRIVIPHNANREHIYSKVREIVHCIGATAGDYGAVQVPQNQHRGFAGYARNFPKHKLIRDHVTEHGHSDARESLNNLSQASGFFGKLTHSSQGFSHACGLGSAIARKIVSTASAGRSSSTTT